jgi:hypothetical protein
LKPSCIIDLSIIYSNYLKPGNIFQITSSVIGNDFKNYKNNSFFPNYIETNNIFKKTNYAVNDTITINSYDNMELKNESYDIIKKNNNNKILIGPESIYITILLSNYFNIPSICNGMTYNYDPGNDINKISKDDGKKIMTHFISLF